MLRKNLLPLLLLLCAGWHTQAQIALSTAPPLNGGISFPGVTFEVTANAAITITELEGAFMANSTTQAEIWYRPGGVLSGGTSPVVDAANGWILAGTTAGPMVGGNPTATTSPIVLTPIPIALAIPVIPGTPVGFFVGNAANNFVIYSNTTSFQPNSVTDGTLTIEYGMNKGFGGGRPGVTINGRGFNGVVKYAPAVGRDVRMSAILQPLSIVVGANPMQVRITNVAADSIVSASFGYQLGANAPVIEGPIVFPQPITTGQSFDYTFTNPLNIPASGTYNLSTWVSDPNGQGPDNNVSNDTISQTVCDGIAGTYTVGGVGADFSDLSTAIAALNCGLSGPVTFLINPGVYTGSYNLQNVLGASTVNTLSFVGAGPGVMIYHLTGANQSRTAFDVNGLNGIRFENIHFVRNADATTAFPLISFTNSSNAKVLNCQFSDSTANTSFNNRAIEIATSDSIEIDNNSFSGFGYVIYSRGVIATYNLHNKISNNVLNQYKIRGIDVQYEDGLHILSNTIHECLSTAGSGLYLSGCNNLLAEKNKITGSIGTYGVYGFNMNGTIAAPNRFYNNDISGTTSVTVPNGFYFSGSVSATATPPNPRDYVDLVFNTVNIKCTGYSTTSTLIGAIYLTGGSTTTPAWSGINIVNNNLALFDNTGGSFPPIGRSLNMANVAISDSLTSNHNNYFATGNAEILRVGSGPGTGAYTLATWQTTFSKDANSFNVDPLFVVPNVGVPTNLALNDQGLSIPTIFEDITGAARGALPDIGAYEIAPRNFDLAIVDLTSPVTSQGLTATELVTVRITNAGLNQLANIPMFYSMNGGVLQTGQFTGPINPGDTMSFTFPTTENLVNAGVYQFLIYSGGAVDDFRFNDTLRTSVTSLNCVSVFPYLENFDAGPGGWLTGGTNNSWAHGAPNASVINRAASGTSAWVTNLTGDYNNNEVSYIESPCFAISGLTAPRIRFNIWWITETNWDGANLQYSTDGGVSWQVLGSVGSGIRNWYTLASVNSSNNLPVWTGDVGSTPPTSGGWVTAEHDASVLVGSSSVVFRFVFTSDGSSTRNGIGIDDFFFGDPPPFDAGIENIISPVSSCSNTLSTPVRIVIKNDGSQPISNFPVGFQVNATTAVIETFTRTIQPNDTAHYLFTATANLLGPASFSFKAFTMLPGDVLAANDTLSRTIVSTIAISNYPYLENFDAGPAGWTSGGANSSWAHGTPNASVINSAASGTSAWVTNLTGDYNGSEQSYIESPCFAIAGTTLSAPRVRFNIWWITETTWDGANLQYSTDGGATWQVLGSLGSGIQNWYTRASVSSSNNLPVWTGDVGATPSTSGGWVTAEHDASVLIGQSSVVFRIFFTSDPSVNRNGIAIDDFFFGDPAPTDGAAIAVLSPSSACGLGNELVTIRLRNDGSQPLTNFPVFYQVNNLPPVAGTFTGTIAPAATADYTFTTPANLGAPGTYTIKGFVAIPGDAISANDTTTANVTNIAAFATFPYLQNFESWTNNTSANFFDGWSGTPQNRTSVLAWHTRSGPPTSANTGPQTDKTLGTAAGKYVFLETSFGGTSDTAFLATQCLDVSSLPAANLSYWYHMYGATTGSLVVQAFSGGTWQQVDLLVGEQHTSRTDPWRERIVSIPNGTTQIRFGGVRGTSFTGDIAIDDVEIRTAPNVDAQLARVVSPSGGGCNLPNSTPVTIVVRNGGLQPLTSLPVNYRVNANPAIVETINQTINPGDTLVYTFTTPLNLSIPNTYTIRFGVDAPNDALPRNDTASMVIVSKPAISTYPYFQNFESGNGGFTTGGVNSSWAMGTPTGNIINSAASGQNAWATNLSGNYNNSEVSYIESPCFSLAGSGLLAPRVQLKLWWVTETNWDGANLQYSTDGGTSWTVLGDMTTGIRNWYNRASVNSSNNQPVWTGDVLASSNPPSSGGWVTAEHSILQLMSFNSVIFRVQFTSDASGQREGFAIDDFFIGDPLQFDVAMNGLSSPTSGCSLGANNLVTISLKNEGAQTLTNIPVSYQLNNGPIITETFAGPLAPNQVATHSFTQPVNLSAVLTHNIRIFTGLTTDLNLMNDTLVVPVTNIVSIATFPYYEDFEGGPGNWIVGGQSPSWRLGVPAGTVINSASSGINSWVTNPNGNYNSNELSYIESPCFNFASMIAPELEMRIWWLTATNAGAYVQYSTDLINWLPLGDLGTGIQNWYNRGNITNYNAGVWSGNATSTPPTSGGWVTAKHELISQGLAGQSQVKFRIVFRSGATLGEGFAMDDFKIIETASSSIDGSVSQIVTPNTTISILNPSQVSVVIRNIGQIPISNFDVAYAINNNSISAQTYTKTILPGSLDTFIFAGNWIPPQSGTFRLCSYLIGIDGDVNNRNDTSCANVNVTYLPVNEGGNPISLYPNPAQDFIILDYNSQQLGDDLVVFDASGRSIYQLAVTGENNRIEIPLKEVSNGFYFYRYRSRNGIYTGKFIVNK